MTSFGWIILKVICFIGIIIGIGAIVTADDDHKMHNTFAKIGTLYAQCIFWLTGLTMLICIMTSEMGLIIIACIIVVISVLCISASK